MEAEEEPTKRRNEKAQGIMADINGNDDEGALGFTVCWVFV